MFKTDVSRIIRRAKRLLVRGDLPPLLEARLRAAVDAADGGDVGLALDFLIEGTRCLFCGNHYPFVVVFVDADPICPRCERLIRN